MRQTFCCYFFSDSAKSFTLHSTSYHIWSCDKLFAVIFFLIQLKVFLSFNFISYMKLRQTFCCYFFSHSAKSFTLHSTSYHIWSLAIYLLLFFSYPAKSFTLHSTSYYIWSCDKLFAVIFFSIQLKVFHSFNFILYMKLRQTICCYFLLDSAKSFSFIQLHIIYEVATNFLLLFFFLSS
jgi:hypothetical protein